MKLIRIGKAAFSLIELLVTLLVFCIILVIALPALNSLLMNNRLRANTDLLVNALNYARNTALSKSMTITVCPFGATDSASCGSNWTSGWIVVMNGTLLQSQQAATGDPSISSTVSSITFDAHGLSTSNGNFTLCDTRGAAFAQSVEVLATGYVQMGGTPGQAVWNNQSLSCPTGG